MLNRVANMHVCLIVNIASVRLPQDYGLVLNEWVNENLIVLFLVFLISMMLEECNERISYQKSVFIAVLTVLVIIQFQK